jgi:hypothetical protein
MVIFFVFQMSSEIEDTIGTNGAAVGSHVVVPMDVEMVVVIAGDMTVVMLLLTFFPQTYKFLRLSIMSCVLN